MKIGYSSAPRATASRITRNARRRFGSPLWICLPDGQLESRQVAVLASQAALFALLFPDANLIFGRFGKGKDLHDVDVNLLSQPVRLELDASDINVVLG